jgi:hypothetical protein
VRPVFPDLYSPCVTMWQHMQQMMDGGMVWGMGLGSLILFIVLILVRRPSEIHLLSMSAGCCNHTLSAARPLLWIALGINASMFAVEVLAGLVAGSVSLHADALDFLGDGFNYAISIAVLTLALTWRARAALRRWACLGYG